MGRARSQHIRPRISVRVRLMVGGLQPDGYWARSNNKLPPVVDCVVFVHYTKDLVDYTTYWSGISRNGGSTCRACTVLYCIDVARPLTNGTQKRCTEINHETLRACRVLCFKSQVSSSFTPNSPFVG